MDAPRLWQPTGLLGERNRVVAIIAEDSVDVAIDVVGSECRFNDITTTNATCDLKLQVSGDDTITTGKEIKIIVN